MLSMQFDPTHHFLYNFKLSLIRSHHFYAEDGGFTLIKTSETFSNSSRCQSPEAKAQKLLDTSFYDGYVAQISNDSYDSPNSPKRLTESQIQIDL
jgi:hypothetical protein